MITQRQLDAVGQDFQAWLLAHKDEFPPLKVLDVRYENDELFDEPIVRLIVMWDASGLGPDEGFSVEGFQSLVRAVNRRQGEGDYPVEVYVRPRATGDDEDDVDDLDGEDD